MHRPKGGFIGYFSAKKNGRGFGADVISSEVSTVVTSGVRIALVVFFFSMLASAQSGPPRITAPPPSSAAGDDSDPTRPVAWSLREEYYNLPGQP